MASSTAVQDFYQGQGVYQLVGGDGSPYSCKMRAVLRYRRIPFRWTPQFLLRDELGAPSDFLQQRFPALKAKVIPVLVRPDGSYANDSTPLILELDATFPDRRLVPAAPGLAFLAALIEDFCDEWLTKVMFEGRFHTQRDAAFGAKWQFWQSPSGLRSPEQSAKLAESFAARQRGRRWIVCGSTGETMFEATLRRVCHILGENLRAGHHFLFGARPTNADFGLFSQMRQLAADPLPASIMHDYPEVWAWVWKMDDLSGYEPPADAAHCGSKGDLTVGVVAFMQLIGEGYLPFLLANDEAIRTGAKEVTVELWGGQGSSLPRITHKQPTFKYQQVCLKLLREQYAALPASDKDFADGVLGDVGRLLAFQAGGASRL